MEVVHPYCIKLLSAHMVIYILRFSEELLANITDQHIFEPK